MPRTIHTNEYHAVVKRLKQARIKAGLTQKETASKIERPQSYISKIEAGEQRLDILELKVFANLYKKKLDYFL